MTDSDCWFKMNKNNLFFCRHHNATMTKQSCICMQTEAINCNINNIISSKIKCLFCNGYLEQYIDYNKIASVICSIGETIPDINI